MMYRYQPLAKATNLAHRYPNIGGATVAFACLLIGIMLQGCECGVGWPCPGK